MPLAFIFATRVVGDLQFATFVAFGCFALLVMADFGGSRTPRAAAYAITTVVGAALIVIGTLASPTPWVGALLMVVIGFTLQFAGVFGGYIAAAQTALMLSFVLSVAIPAPASAIGGRILGWLLAGVLSTTAGVLSGLASNGCICEPWRRRRAALSPSTSPRSATTRMTRARLTG